MWTVQRLDIYEQHILTVLKYRAEWEHVEVEWLGAYRWMADRMLTRGMPLGEHAPIWSWQHPQSLSHLQSVYSSAMIEAHTRMALIEFTPNHEFVLASSYSDFTNLWWAIKKGRDLTDFDRTVFALDQCEDEDIQVVVPWLMAGEINKDNVKVLTLRSVHEGGPTTEPYSANKSMEPTG